MGPPSRNGLMTPFSPRQGGERIATAGTATSLDQSESGEEHRYDPPDGVTLMRTEAHPRSCPDAPTPVRLPKNLPDARSVLSATTGSGARSPARFRKRFFGRRTGCGAFPHVRGGRLSSE